MGFPKILGQYYYTVWRRPLGMEAWLSSLTMYKQKPPNVYCHAEFGLSRSNHLSVIRTEIRRKYWIGYIYDFVLVIHAGLSVTYRFRDKR